jgi:hypothetical protein
VSRGEVRPKAQSSVQAGNVGVPAPRLGGAQRTAYGWLLSAPRTRVGTWREDFGEDKDSSAWLFNMAEELGGLRPVL